jgi:F0F1-type ATP synthase membrane subunit c/vacuolar-type H+-ATPase subunit K
MKGWWLGIALGLALCGSAGGQGCSQCRESVGQTPERTQRAYRRAIVVMVVAAGCVCGATVMAVRRFR